MSHTENSVDNCQNHVSNNVESNSPEPVQSTHESQNSLSATNQCALDITDKTVSSTQSSTQRNVAGPSRQNNSARSSLPNTQGFDIGESSSQSKNIPPNFRMQPELYRYLSRIVAESIDKHKCTTCSVDHLKNIHPSLIENIQENPHWHRVVPVDVNEAESNVSFSSPQPQKIQRTENGRRNTAGVTNSQSDVEWYHKVNRDVIESQTSVSSSQPKILERRTERQHPTPPSSSFQAHSSNSRSESSVNNIHCDGSQTELIVSNTQSNENERYQSDSVISPALHCQLQNSNSIQSPAASIFSNSERVAAQNTTFVPSSNVTNNSNRSQVLTDLDDIATNTEDQPNSSNEVNQNSVTNEIEILSTHPPTNSPGINESETLEIIIRSSNNADYKVVISNPAIIKTHKVLQRRILCTNNTISSSENNSILYQQVNDYMQELRSNILSTDSNSSRIALLMSDLVPQALTIRRSPYPPLTNTSEMPPVNIIDRIQNGCVIKELTNCVVCLEDNNGNVLLEPCNHYNLCGTCMERLTIWICPICRSHITNIIVYV